jgi:hypothetical protein
MALRSGSAIQPVTVAMRRMLYVASVLVFIAGIQTFVLSEDTGRFFAWTIAIPLTTAFLGTGIWPAPSWSSWSRGNAPGPVRARRCRRSGLSQR